MWSSVIYRLLGEYTRSGQLFGTQEHAPQPHKPKTAFDQVRHIPQRNRQDISQLRASDLSLNWLKVTRVRLTTTKPYTKKPIARVLGDKGLTFRESITVAVVITLGEKQEYPFSCLVEYVQKPFGTVSHADLFAWHLD